MTRRDSDNSKEGRRASLCGSHGGIFDWGDKSVASAGTGVDNDVIHDQVTRYDPSNMNRIADITDLDISTYSSDDSDDDVLFPGHRVGVRIADVENNHGTNIKNNNHNNKYGPSSSSSSSAANTSTPFFRKTAVIISLVGIIIGASAAIGYTVVNSETIVSSQLSAADGSSGGGGQQQRLLEIAERVTIACDENMLNEDMSECQNLCNGRMCCFESDEYGCQDDTRKDCAVYAGCEALVMGVPVGAADEDEA